MLIFTINVFLVLWALHQFGLLRSMGPIRTSRLEKPGVELMDYFVPSILLGFVATSWRVEFIKQSQLWRSQVWDFRRFLFSSSQTLLSFFWLMLCLALFLEVNGMFVVGLGLILFMIGYIPRLKNIPIVPWLGSFVYFGLTLYFLGLAFQNSGLMMQYLMDSEIVFFFTIDSIINWASVFLISTLVGFFVPVQGWSFVVTYLLYLNSQASFLIFVFMVVGELLGTALSLMMYARSWDTFYRKKTQGLFVSVIGYLIAFAVGALVWRYFFSFGASYNQLIVLKWIYLGTLFLLLAGLYVTIMTWGHFAAAKQDKEVVVSDAGLIQELKTAGDVVTVFIVSQLKQRREKLLGYKSDLDGDPESRNKIPLFVLNQFEAEIKIIDSLK